MDKKFLHERLDKLAKELNAIIEELGNNEQVYVEYYYSEDRINWTSIPTVKSCYLLNIGKATPEKIIGNIVKVKPIKPFSKIPPYEVIIKGNFKEGLERAIVYAKNNAKAIDSCVEFNYNLRIEEWKIKPN